MQAIVSKLSPARDLHGRYTSAIGQFHRTFDGIASRAQATPSAMATGRLKTSVSPVHATTPVFKCIRLGQNFEKHGFQCWNTPF